MDDASAYNKERWDALVKAGALFTRPWLKLDSVSAQQKLELGNFAGAVKGKRVLCLASGGGQQSAAFSVLGAEVSVLDISEGQLEKDREAANHYGFKIQTLQGDMRDLSAFKDAFFDIVWHPYSLNFVPNSREVFREVARVLRADGLYHFMAANPFACGVGTKDWNHQGYVLKDRYVDGAPLTYKDEDWVFRDPEKRPNVEGPREYRQTLSTLLNGLVDCNLILLRIKEEGLGESDLEAEPGSWGHLVSVIPPWIKFWAVHKPGLMTRTLETELLKGGL